MMRMHNQFIVYYHSIHAGWFRLLGKNGPGVSWTLNLPLYSERMGYRRPFITIGKYRFFFLKPIDKQ